MAKVVRLKGPEQREWNANLSILVDEDGTIVRQITAKESLTMFQVGKHVTRTRQPHTIETPEEGSKVEARLEALEGGGLMVRFYIDGYVVVGGREAMKARYLAEHGACLLYRTNGKLLCRVIDPTLRVPLAAEANRTTPSPDICTCKDWAGREQGKHHPVCQHNDRAPMTERGSFGSSQAPTAGMTVVAAQPQMPVTPAYKPVLAPGTKIPGLGGKPKERIASGPAPQPQTKPVGHIPGIPEPTVPSPSECVCHAWALPDGVEKFDRDTQHHPICQFKDKWVPPLVPAKPEEVQTQPENEAPSTQVKYLVNTNTGAVLREATADELIESDKNDGIVVIDKVPYGIVDESGVEDEPEKPESD